MPANQPKREPFSFTQRRVSELPAPTSGRAFVYDTATPGLAIQITPAGTKTYYLVKKVGGRKVRVRLGDAKAITVSTARDLTAELLGQVARGVDPAAAKRAGREEPTFADLWSHRLAYAKAHNRPKSVSEDERNYKTFLARWAARKLTQIKRADVQALHSRIGAGYDENVKGKPGKKDKTICRGGHYAANRVLALVSTMFNMAADLGIKVENPARGVKKYKEEPRDRFLSDEELPLFWDALHQEKNEAIRDLFTIALLTGARRSNLQALRWEDVKLNWKLWRIPGDDAKSGAPIMVPLDDAVLDILLRRQTSATSEWVFPSHGKTGHIVETKAAMQRLLKRSGLTDFHFHDIRRTCGSWQAIGGASLSVIGKSLGHTQTQTTAIYARLSMDPVRQSMGTAAKAMLAHDKTRNGSGDVIEAVAEKVGTDEASKAG